MKLWRLFSRDPVTWRRSRIQEGLSRARDVREQTVIQGKRYDTARSSVIWAWWEFDAYSDSIYGLWKTPNERYFVWGDRSGFEPLSHAEAVTWLRHRDVEAAVQEFGEIPDA